MVETSNRHIIANTPSGAIEWLFTGTAVVVQFNTTCEDALPYCHAMCCRLRPALRLIVDADEAHLYDVEPDRTMKADPVRGCCTYLRDDLCTIHATKPSCCRRWHCSPGGKGDGITERRDGWMLFPATWNLQWHQTTVAP